MPSCLPIAIKPATVSVLWSSSWGVAGTTDTIKKDSGQWNDVFDSAGLLAVVAAPGTSPGFTNALRVLRNTATQNDAGQIVVQGAWSAPVTGETLYWRGYIYMDMSTSTGTLSSHHPCETAYTGGSTSGWNIKLVPTGSSQWRIQLFIPYGPDSQEIVNVTGLAIQRWYRFGVVTTCTATDVFTVQFYLYDDTNALVSGPNTVANVDLDADELAKLRLGTNGGGPWGNAGAEYFYWGGFAVATADPGVY